MNTKGFEQTINVGGEADGDGHVGDGVFKNQVPTDNPGDQFAERRIRVGIGAAGNGNHGGQFCVTQACKSADNRDKKKRKSNRRTRAGAPADSRRMRAVEEHI